MFRPIRKWFSFSGYRGLAASPLLALCAVLASLAAPGAARAQQRLPLTDAKGRETFYNGEIVFTIRRGTPRADVDALVATVNAKVVRGLGVVGAARAADAYHVRIGGAPTRQDTLAAVAKLAQDPRVVAASVNRHYYVRGQAAKGPGARAIPNDPDFGKQWGLTMINMPAAWDVQKGASNVTLCVTDDAIDIDHPEFQALGARLLPGFNGLNGGSDPRPANGEFHGTHTSGIAIAQPNNGIGIAGVVWNNVKFLPQSGTDGAGGLSTASLLACYQHLLQYMQANPGQKCCLNLSLGGTVSSEVPPPYNQLAPDEQALVDLSNAGCVICVAINEFGHDGPPGTPDYLANPNGGYPNFIAVTALGPDGLIASYPGFYGYNTIAAPGGDGPEDPAHAVYSTFPVSQGSYGSIEGTSMACPFATGVVALLLSFPNVQPGDVRPIIEASARAVSGFAAPSREYGYGILDAAAAVNLAASGVQLSSPASGAFVAGNVPVQLSVGDSSKFVSASLTIDNDPAIVATTTASPYTLAWNSLATDPTTGALKYPNGTHTLAIAVTLTGNKQVVLTRQVRLDNPIAAITAPAASAYVTGSVNVVGTSDGLRVPTFTLEYAAATAPSTWVPIVSAQTGRVQNAALGTWNLSGIADGPVTLRLRVKNPDGFEVSATNQVTVDQTQPTVPANLQGTATNRQDTLTWSASTDNFQLAGYNVYRSDQSLTGFAKLNAALLTSTQFVDPNLTNGHTYFYKVTAVDAAGNESAQSALLSLTPNRNGTTSGTVNALDGTFLAGATITVLQNGSVVPNGTATTDQSGQYTFPSPPGFAPGTYDIEANASGYVPQLVKGVTVDIGKDALQQNFVLQPQPTFPSGWSAFTLPYDFQGAAITAVLPGGDVRYYDPASGAYLTPGQPGFPNPAPGIGYWVNNTGTAPNVAAPGVPDTQTTVAAVPIHKGWNLIGNPFLQPIHWSLNSMVIQRADNGQQASLSAAVGLGWALDFGWGGTDGKTLLYDPSVIPGVSSDIPAYGAFWFRSEVDGTLSLSPPANVNRAASRRATGAGGGGWLTQIQATAAGQSATAYIGIGASHRVFPTAPRMDPTVRIALADGTAATTDAGGTATGNGVDVRSGRAAQTWDLVVQTPDETPVTLTWPALSTLPRGWHLAITDMSTGRRLSMNGASSIALPASRAAHTLKVELTRDTMNRLMITDLHVSTTRAIAPVISYTVTADTTATISVLRSNGTTVRMLATRSAAAGANTLVWDGRDNSGHAVPPGLYLVQVRAVAQSGDAVRAVMPFIVTR